ncbi:hypothetical protein N7481_002802 [Penicillium waksmanii]|uniref:uncharacterized protein n=1 Tax=Penicillium waksmanii TaxID=69791 RepID=UPI0025489B07|nr:uncharacterized protein N7481_002802 [Penicillium waksmanii]KAJ5995825.1 hypothetical protein N7481_002802 [Penicillium waksmanii]
MMKETISDRNQIRPHPYFTTKLHKFKCQKLDYCVADDLFHLYPSILALGVVLIEIATKQPFRPESPHYIWDETTINDYYEWAWTTANLSKLRNTIGAAYESVVNNCLDSELFRLDSIDPSRSDNDLQSRQSILYEKVVLPLQELYHAYKDDWEIQDISRSVLTLPRNFQANLNLGSMYITNQAQRDEAENSEVTTATQTFPHITTLQSDPPSAMPNPMDYNVGWICAITTEYVAAQAFLDERHDWPGYFPPLTKNDYTLGRIGKHNVVISVLPMGEYGISSAARVAEEMTHSFPNIRIRLMVGIGGGVPSSKHDIRLGDVVVSIPNNGQAGVLQYDFGKSIQGQSFKMTGRLDQPPTALRSAVGGLVAQYESKGHQLQNTVDEALKEDPTSTKKIWSPGSS